MIMYTANLTTKSLLCSMWHPLEQNFFDEHLKLLMDKSDDRR